MTAAMKVGMKPELAQRRKESVSLGRSQHGL